MNHPRLPQGKRRAAFSLLELLVVMAVLAVFLGVASGTILLAMRAYQADHAAANRLIAQNTLADAFRADVARAMAAPAHDAEVAVGPTCLLLLVGDGKRVIYEVQDQPGRAGKQVERRVADGKATTTQLFSLADERTSVEFLRGEPDGRLLTLRWRDNVGPASTPRVLDFAAALQGDLR